MKTPVLESLFNKGCSCEYCEHFKDTYLEEYLRTTAPEYILEYGVLVKFHSKSNWVSYAKSFL